ncbi:PH domain-containing protein [Methanofollis tationis]|uniref:PH domain-containing protein n=1 Tax=Methanofollis tationis TaxID=81417 RepID=A0A7K4HS41_9EURY|nr:PH domain-containing protein [Methanofollis tationis]NVO67867.1 PH domain-containing protein [Methanofollis tationis]
MSEEITIGKEFKPAPRFRAYYFLSLIIVIVFLVAFAILPTIFAGAPLPVILAIALGISAIAVFVGAWIPMYYQSILYHLTPTEMTWRRGVWFRQTGIVPYNRITNVDIIQGPVMRYFGISDLRIQTAGYSAQPQAEIKLMGIEEPEPLRELIMAQVRGRAPVAAATGGAETSGEEGDVIAELRAIRHLLEGMAGEKR